MSGGAQEFCDLFLGMSLNCWNSCYSWRVTVLKVSYLHIFVKQQLNNFMLLVYSVLKIQEKLRAWKRILPEHRELCYSLDKSALFTARLLPVSCFPGVFLPLHRVCCLHHAAFLHERGHYCQRHHLPVAHRHPEHLPGLQSHRAGTFGLAGKADSVRQDCWNPLFTP